MESHELYDPLIGLIVFRLFSHPGFKMIFGPRIPGLF
jgi:hypothetical protein